MAEHQSVAAVFRPCVDAFPQNHASAQKANTGDDLARDPGRIAAVSHDREGDKARRPQGHERIGPQTRHFLVPLPLDADGRTQKKSHAEP